MDYVVGSVAALISGNVTPNRPKKNKKPLTPMKHQPSPNVTPKCELIEDRSIFLSPTLQKKKAIVKKSPKRIFQNPDLDVTKEDEESTVTSPKADKVKKHLKDELEANSAVDQIMLSPKSPKNKQEKNHECPSPKKKLKLGAENNEIPSKKKKKQKLVAEAENLPVDENVGQENEKENVTTNIDTTENVSTKNKKKKSKAVTEKEVVKEADTNTSNEKKKNKRKKKNKSKETPVPDTQDTAEQPMEIATQRQDPAEQEANKQSATKTATKSPKKKNKKRKNKQKKADNSNAEPENINVNANAVTNKDTDSEHESDDEIESENEEINKKAFKTAPPEESSEDEAEKDAKPAPAKKEAPVATADEIKRTIFVGNVPFSSKCKKEIKKIFSQYGQIETVRIRTIPVKDARVTPKMAVIKKELHPDRTTVNVYVKFIDKSSVDKALAANNTVLNEHHLRVSRSDTTGAEHDPKNAVFVGNIPFALEDETLRAKFEKCGEIESVRIIRDKKTNAGKGFGYVNFASKDGVELALALTEEDLTIKNRILRVKRCTQPTQRKFAKPERKVQSRHNPGQQFGRGRFPDKQKDDKNDGAYRRVMNKRKYQENNDGPPNKRQNLNQPPREKKARKEFVGMTAEKKKKQKFNKGQKKKKVLSEILTKK